MTHPEVPLQNVNIRYLDSQFGVWDRYEGALSPSTWCCRAALEGAEHLYSCHLGAADSPPAQNVNIAYLGSQFGV